MTPKEELQQIYKLDKRIKSLKDTIVEHRTRQTNISPVLSDMPRAGNNSNRMESGLVKGEEYAEKLNKMYYESCRLKQAIIAKIDLLDNENYKTVLRQRYINYKSFEEISIIFPYSYNHTLKLHGHALQAYGKLSTEQQR